MAGLRLNDPSTTPVAYTRGLNATGTWNGTATDGTADRGVYNETGGHIVFLGGNVQFYASIDSSLVANTGRATSNLLQALPRPGGSGASAVRVLGRDWANSIASESGVVAAAGP